MLKELSKRIEQHPNLQVVILQGVQKREEILYANEFKPLHKNTLKSFSGLI